MFYIYISYFTVIMKRNFGTMSFSGPTTMMSLSNLNSNYFNNDTSNKRPRFSSNSQNPQNLQNPQNPHLQNYLSEQQVKNLLNDQEKTMKEIFREQINVKALEVEATIDKKVRQKCSTFMSKCIQQAREAVQEEVQHIISELNVQKRVTLTMSQDLRELRSIIHSFPKSRDPNKRPEFDYFG